MANFYFGILFLILWSFYYQYAESAHVTATGRIYCHGRGVPYTKISLRDRDFPVNKKMGESTTNHDGYFTVSGSASDIGFGKARRPDVFIRVEYRRYATSAIFEVKQPWYRKKDRSAVLKNRKGNVDFGLIKLNTEECLTYLRFYDATNDFYNKVHYRVPFDLTIRTRYIIHGGTPYAAYRTIHLPAGTNLRTDTAEHELAHTVRHHYDGSLSHFLGDVAKYLYTQKHSCSSKTNKGFAFNEGWAEYWANTCQSGKVPGLSVRKVSQEVEENVATGLSYIQSTCSTSDHNMWEVLRINKGKIHSYSDFQHYHKQLYHCP